MITYSLEQKGYQTLAEAINTFSGITQIDTAFYTLDGQLLKNGSIFQKPEEVQHSLSGYSDEIFSIFPVTMNYKLWGLVICNSVNVSQQRISLSRNYLENIIGQIFESDSDVKIVVWDALGSEGLSAIRNFDTYLRNETSKKISSAPIESMPAIDGHERSHSTSLNDDTSGNIYHSLQACLNYIKNNIDQTISLDEVAQHVFLSPSYLSRIFKKTMHVNFIDYINNQKIAIAGEQLCLTESPVSHIAKQIGFAQTSYFTKIFKQHTGLTPSEFRQRNASIQKIVTIHRDLTWNDSDSVYDISKQYFQDHDISYYSQPVNGFPYINSIAGLADSSGQRGWIFTVDCKQPNASSMLVPIKGKSVIQWIYTEYPGD
ncbi:helix-turn-helix domain-containing protein [Lentilactobacillus kisonensis]|nr:helix-turn-helix domain-containing protein [Lentilactobacillus kisonensis]